MNRGLHLLRRRVLKERRCAGIAIAVATRHICLQIRFSLFLQHCASRSPACRFHLRGAAIMTTTSGVWAAIHVSVA